MTANRPAPISGQDFVDDAAVDVALRVSVDAGPEAETDAGEDTPVTPVGSPEALSVSEAVNPAAGFRKLTV